MSIISAPIPPPHPSLRLPTEPSPPRGTANTSRPVAAAAPLPFSAREPDPPGLKGTGGGKGPQDPMAGPKLPRSAPWLGSCSPSRRGATCKSSTGAHRRGPNGLGRRKGEGGRRRNFTDEDAKSHCAGAKASGFPFGAPPRSLLPSRLRGSGRSRKRVT